MTKMPDFMVTCPDNIYRTKKLYRRTRLAIQRA